MTYGCFPMYRNTLFLKKKLKHVFYCLYDKQDVYNKMQLQEKCND